jgi:hypothetical protein
MVCMPEITLYTRAFSQMKNSGGPFEMTPAKKLFCTNGTKKCKAIRASLIALCYILHKEDLHAVGTYVISKLSVWSTHRHDVSYGISLEKA